MAGETTLSLSNSLPVEYLLQRVEELLADENLSDSTLTSLSSSYFLLLLFELFSPKTWLIETILLYKLLVMFANCPERVLVDP